MELDIAEDPERNRQKNAHPHQTGSGEGVSKAGTRVPGDPAHLRLTGHAAGIHPAAVVLQQLPGKAAEIQ